MSAVVWPTGSEAKPRITDGYGPREPIYIPGQGWTSAFHHGVDIPQPQGYAWRAPFSGKVIFSGPRGGLGSTVVIEGRVAGRRVQAVIPHNIAKGMAPRGRRVVQGETVAYCGDTGQALGYHTCFRLYVGGDWQSNTGSVDPEKYIPAVNSTEQEDDDMPRFVLGRYTGATKQFAVIHPNLEGGLQRFYSQEDFTAALRSWGEGIGSDDVTWDFSLSNSKEYEQALDFHRRLAEKWVKPGAAAPAEIDYDRLAGAIASAMPKTAVTTFD